MEQQVQIPEDVELLCSIFQMTPAELLEQFMRDLCSMNLNGGLQARIAAKEYFVRTPQATCSDELRRHAVEVVFDLEDIYQSAHPSAENVGWEERRRALLSEFALQWQSLTKPTQPTT